jgi:hypothetical protein
MNYQTLSNDRRRRRKARFITFLVTASLLASFAYAAGLLDQLPEMLDLFRETDASATPVANA